MVPQVYGDFQEERLCYQPPKSAAYGHASRLRNPRVGWPFTVEFLEKFTIHYDYIAGIRLSCSKPGKYTDETVAINRIQAAEKIFGPVTNAFFPEWKLTLDQLPLAIEFALDDDKWPRQDLGPVSLYFSYILLWREFLVCPAPSRQDVVEYMRQDKWDDPGKSPLSRLGVSLGQRRLFLQPFFQFPFPYNSETGREFLACIEENLPFRFRDQYFKRMPRSKKGTYGRMRKLPKGWRQVTIGD
jgi:hypothetical protein